MDARDAQAAMIVARLAIVTQITGAIITRNGQQSQLPKDVVTQAGEYADEILKQNPFPV